MTRNEKEHFVLDIVVPGLTFVACILAALLILAMITTAPAKASLCPYGYHWQCTSWTGNKSCSCVPN